MSRKSMELRMWRYAMQLRLRHGRPVIPIVLYLRGGPPGVSARTVEERFGELFLGRFLLAECVENYGELNDAEEETFQALLAQEVNREVATMEMTRSERLRQEGRQEGWQEGRREGEKEGEQRGYLKGMQTLLLDMVRQRFGNLSPATERQVRALTSAEELSRLAGEVMAGRKPPELGL